MIGVMVPSTGKSGLKSLVLVLAMALAAFAVGCDASGDDEERGAEAAGEAVAEGSSELESARGEPREDGAIDRGDVDGGVDTEVDGRSGGPSSPLDDVAGPDPIPWHRDVKRSAPTDA